MNARLKFCHPCKIAFSKSRTEMANAHFRDCPHGHGPAILKVICTKYNPAEYPGKQLISSLDSVLTAENPTHPQHQLYQQFKTKYDESDIAPSTNPTTLPPRGTLPDIDLIIQHHKQSSSPLKEAWLELWYYFAFYHYPPSYNLDSCFIPVSVVCSDFFQTYTHTPLSHHTPPSTIPPPGVNGII